MPQFKEIDKLLRIVSRSSERVSRLVSRKVQEMAYKYLDRLEVLSDGKINDSAENKKILESLKKDVLKFLADSGLDKKMTDEVMAHYDLMRLTVEKINSITGTVIPPGFTNSFQEYKTDAYKNLLGKMGEADRSMQKGVKAALNKFAVGGRDFISLKNEVAAQVERIHHVNAISVTGAMTIINNGNDQVAELAGFENRKFLGPVDKLRRPFCIYFSSKVVKNEWIDKLSNGHGLPVRTNCGGYHCRHIWLGTNQVTSWEELLNISFYFE